MYPWYDQNWKNHLTDLPKETNESDQYALHSWMIFLTMVESTDVAIHMCTYLQYIYIYIHRGRETSIHKCIYFNT